MQRNIWNKTGGTEIQHILFRAFRFLQCFPWFLETLSLRRRAGPHEIHDFLQRTAGWEDLGNSYFPQPGGIAIRNNPAGKNQHVIHSVFPKQTDDLREKMHVSPGQDGKPDGVDILLQGGVARFARVFAAVRCRSTSIPASRSARAITLAPRSWPSSPGFATKTRIFFYRSWAFLERAAFFRPRLST